MPGDDEKGKRHRKGGAEVYEVTAPDGEDLVDGWGELDFPVAAAGTAADLEDAVGVDGVASVDVDEAAVLPGAHHLPSERRSFSGPAARMVADKYRNTGGDYLEYDNHAHWIYAAPGW
jgi:hypothetical protein